MSVDAATVKRIAHLARISVSEEQAATMTKELNGILAWVEQLSAIDTAGIAPMTSPVQMTLKMREDVVTDGGYAEDIVRNAPGHEETFFTVPKVVE